MGLWVCVRRGRRRGWLDWSLSGVAGYLGYVPGALPPAPAPALAPPSEADIRDLYRDLDLDPRALLGAGPSPAAASAVHLAVNLQAPSPSALPAASVDLFDILRCHALRSCELYATGVSQKPSFQDTAGTRSGWEAGVLVQHLDLLHCLQWLCRPCSRGRKCPWWRARRWRMPRVG